MKANLHRAISYQTQMLDDLDFERINIVGFINNEGNLGRRCFDVIYTTDNCHKLLRGESWLVRIPKIKEVEEG